MLILDTNVISEMMRAAPEPAVVQWLARHAAGAVFLTAVTTAELRYGVAVLPAGVRKSRLEAAIEGMIAEEFAGRVLPFDDEAASAYAAIAAHRKAVGHPISQLDCQIAAIARVRRSTGDAQHERLCRVRCGGRRPLDLRAVVGAVAPSPAS